MTDCQVKTRKCDFCFMLTSLNNDDQSCAHKLKVLKILGGTVDDMMELIAQNQSISMTSSVEVMSLRIITNFEDVFFFIANK